MDQRGNNRLWNKVLGKWCWAMQMDFEPRFYRARITEISNTDENYGDVSVSLAELKPSATIAIS